MQAKDKVEQLKASLQAKKEAEERVASAKGMISPGLEDQYKKKITELEEALNKAKGGGSEFEEKFKETQEKFVRLYAEFENYRKRAAKDIEEAKHYGYEKVVKEILPVLDGLEKALEHAAQAEDREAIVQGIELVLKQFLKAIENFGVRPLYAVGQPFDPNYHEAMAHQESEEHEPDTVVQEYRRGYVFQNKLLRPALVTVAKPPEKK